jgi:hypothetical protein
VHCVVALKDAEVPVLSSSTPPASMAMSAAWYSKLCLFTVVVFPTGSGWCGLESATCVVF